MDASVVEEIREVMERRDVTAHIFDLHVWRSGRGKCACIVGVVGELPLYAACFRKALRVYEESVHMTVEVGVP